MPPVVTVTLNPAIDQTITVEGLRPGAVHRASSVQLNAGGKGVNVASVLADWGVPVAATGILGAANAAPFEALFTAKRIDDRFVRTAGHTRTNIKIADTVTGETTDINLPGPAVDRAVLERVETVLAALTVPGLLVVLAGSLPAGLPVDTLARLTAGLMRAGARVVLDTSGPPLAAALAAPGGALPCVIKPNRHELAAWAGTPLDTPGALADTARRLQARGIDLVVVSLGADGALFAGGGGVLWGRLPPVTAISTVGAGDAMVAGLVAGLRTGAPLDAVARLAIAFAAAKLGRVGPHLPDRDAVQSLAAQVVLTGTAGTA